MTREEVKEELKGYLRAKREYERLISLLEETETRIQGLSIDYSKLRVQSSPDPDKLSGSIDKLNNIRNSCIDMADKSTKRMEDVFNLINKVDDVKLRELLTRRYIRDETWEEIAFKMKPNGSNRNSYSWTGIHKLHDSALKKCEKIMKSV